MIRRPVIWTCKLSRSGRKFLLSVPPLLVREDRLRHGVAYEVTLVQVDSRDEGED